jgi:hypothetical protein
MGVYVDKEFRVNVNPLKLAASLLLPIKLKMVVRTINATFRNVSTERVPVRKWL